jgi:hypothetical protein
MRTTSCRHWAVDTKRAPVPVHAHDPASGGPHRAAEESVLTVTRRAYHPRMDLMSPSVAEQVADVAGALAPRGAEVSADVYDLIVREIPQLRADRQGLTLLDTGVGENVATVLHILQHGIDLERIGIPPAAEEHVRRLAQRGVPLTAVLRSYRIGATRFQHWCFQELAGRTADAAAVSAAGLLITEVIASYIDRVSEELVSTYEHEREHWLHNLSAARDGRVKVLLRGDRVDIDSSEAILGYRLRQHHVGVVCWMNEAEAGAGALARLERATVDAAKRGGCEGRPMFVPQDGACAWAWLPLGGQRSLAAETSAASDDDIRFAFGAAGTGLDGFRRTHQQALGAQAVATAAGPSGPTVTSFRDVAPLALMASSIELTRAWVAETLGALADDDEPTARLRETLRVFLSEKGSFKATAEKLTLHKNTVQYRVRKAEDVLGVHVDENRLQIELALLACRWLGVAVLRSGPHRL